MSEEWVGVGCFRVTYLLEEQYDKGVTLFSLVGDVGRKMGLTMKYTYRGFGHSTRAALIF